MTVGDVPKFEWSGWSGWRVGPPVHEILFLLRATSDTSQMP